MTKPIAVSLVALMLAPLSSVAQTSGASGELHRLFDEAWAYDLEEFPTSATFAGDHRFDDRLASMSFEALARRNEADRVFLSRLERQPSKLRVAGSRPASRSIYA